MPELPEVETVKNGLNKYLPNKQIIGVMSDWTKSFPNADESISNFLIGAKVIDLQRRGKALIINLDTGYSLVIHLKMTGQLVYKGHEQKFGAGHPNDSLVSELPDRSTRVVVYLSSDTAKLTRKPAKSPPKAITRLDRLWTSYGLVDELESSNQSKLFFNDQRKFGWVRLLPTIEVPNIDFMKKLGPEPLDPTTTASIFRDRALRRKNSNVKAVLLDQTVIAGIGNIYADESLWMAKIHPETLVRNLSPAKMNKLFIHIKDVLELSINSGGSTDKNYVNADGRKGSYLTFAKVFRREGQPCLRCGTTIVKTRVAGRGTHTCPKCQKVVS
jgi:formamidopyrimidine-DNA glycosylase